MVSAHSHAFQVGLRGRGETYPSKEKASSFWTWREEMYQLVGEMDRASLKTLTAQTFREMLAAGITCVGEFHYFHHGAAKYDFDDVILEAARETGIRLTLIETAYMQGTFGDAPLSTAQARFETRCAVAGFVERMS